MMMPQPMVDQSGGPIPMPMMINPSMQGNTPMQVAPGQPMMQPITQGQPGQPMHTQGQPTHNGIRLLSPEASFTNAMKDILRVVEDAGVAGVLAEAKGDLLFLKIKKRWGSHGDLYHLRYFVLPGRCFDSEHSQKRGVFTKDSC